MVPAPPPPVSAPQQPTRESSPVPTDEAILLRPRIDHIIQLLTDFRVSDETRAFLFQLNRHNKRYCASCSPAHTPGACGPTCSLLRPRAVRPETIEPDWFHDAMMDHQLYKRLVDEVKTYAHVADAARVQGWENAAEHLRRGARSFLEKNAESDWTYHLDVLPVEGMTPDWSFEGAWGKGKGTEEDVAPDDVGDGMLVGQSGTGDGALGHGEPAPL